MPVRIVLACMLSLFALHHAYAQRPETAISAAEDEKVRDAAPFPAQRVAVYQELIETRVRHIQATLAARHTQKHREEIGESLDEIAGLVDELEDNLQEYDKAHRDLRKPLPRLLDAMLLWESVLKQIPAEDSDDLKRKLALEDLGDVKQETAEMVSAQAAYFKAHPPDKNANPDGAGGLHHE